MPPQYTQGVCTCKKCGKTMSAVKFFTYKDGRKSDFCKTCLTMHIDNFDESTFLWILEDFDVPYIPSEWNVIRDKEYAKDPNGLTGASVLGKYLAKMRLHQFKKYGYADSEAATAEREGKNLKPMEIDPEFEAEMKAKLDAGEISEAQYKTLVTVDTQAAVAASYAAENVPQPTPGPVPVGSFSFYPEDLPAPPPIEIDLTEEDRKYLAMKWGYIYKPEEWIELERKWNEMKDSFDIQDSDTEGTLLLICKTFLKMNQAIDGGDMTAYQQLARVYDNLRKSAKFTAAQNKAQKDEFVDSIGELIAICERQGFIPRYVTDTPQDVIDVTLKDMNDYTYKLVTQDLGFGQQIEDALKKIQIQKELNELEDEGEDANELQDDDIAAFYEDLEIQKIKDQYTQGEGQ